MKKYILKEHNSKDQMNWAGCDDTRKYLRIGEKYEAKEEIHDWYTKLIIDGKKYNSVCFKEI